MTKKMLTRDVIIRTLAATLEPLDYVHAFYEGGAAAFNRIDNWSDIDLYLVVENDKVNEAFRAVEQALNSLSRIKQKHKIPRLPWPGVSQAFYRLEDTNEYLIIDFVILKLSSPTKFLEPEIHGNVIFYFKKSGWVSHPRLDKGELVRKLDEKLERLQARFTMFNHFVQKEINRGNYLEALDLYYNLILGGLIEILRIENNPFHHDFKMRYVHYELSSETLERLRHLHFVRDENDLQEKYREATEWVRDVMSKIDPKEIEGLIKCQSLHCS